MARRRRAVELDLPLRSRARAGCVADGDDLGMQLELSGVEVRSESWTEGCACTIENASAYVVTVITVLERHSLSMVSAYVADLSGQTAVTHMQLAPGPCGEL